MFNLGIMVNNRCNARCAHCLYASSPDWPDDYMSDETCQSVAETLDDFSIPSVHIGGGEPFLHFDGLCTVLKTLADADIDIDYIETNALWCGDEKTAREKILRVKALGGNTLMASCDPFHASYIPLERVITFVRLCRECAMDYFVWHEAYLTRFLQMGIPRERPLSVQELSELLGEDYRERTAAEYGLAFNGRALGLLETMTRKMPAGEAAGQCRGTQLAKMDTGHIDYAGRFLPGHCLGFGVDLVWALEGAKPGRYPIVDLVREKGLCGLLALCREMGFREDARGYVSCCALCMELKRFLCGKGYDEIYPAPFFENVGSGF